MPNDLKTGWVFWITGLSGSGKTTVGRLLFHELRRCSPASVFLDGDELRQVFGNDLGYSLEERKCCADRYSRLARMLADQGLHVVVATISMFDDCRSWNRENIAHYFEIYLRAPMEILIERDVSGLYRGGQTGVPGSVVGMDVVAEEPSNSDLIIENDGSQSPSAIAELIWRKADPLLRSET